jgi:hypothetical protein
MKKWLNSVGLTRKLSGEWKRHRPTSNDSAREWRGTHGISKKRGAMGMIRRAHGERAVAAQTDPVVAARTRLVRPNAGLKASARNRVRLAGPAGAAAAAKEAAGATALVAPKDPDARPSRDAVTGLAAAKVPDGLKVAAKGPLRVAGPKPHVLAPKAAATPNVGFKISKCSLMIYVANSTSSAAIVSRRSRPDDDSL